MTVDLLARRSLPAAWAANWAADAAKPVLHHPDTGLLTAAEVEERTAQAAARLAGTGLRPGDRVLISASSSVDLVVAHVACLRAGFVVVPANTAYRERELAHLVADARPSLAIVDDEERAAWVTAAAPIPVADPALAALTATSTPPPLDTAALGDIALLGYTSGTTGAPKGAILTHGNLLAGAEALLIAWHWTADDRLLLTLPLFHMHGMGVGLHGSLLAGSAILLRPGFDAADVTAVAPEATMFFGVPTMYARLVDHPDVGRMAGLRLCVSGSAPLPPSLFDAFAALTGQRVLERYGMTETMMNLSNPYDGERRPGTVGFPLPGVEVKHGVDGEILVRGPNVTPGYWDRPDATAEAFEHNGWFHTGDVGTCDPDGYHRIVGRTKELIITGGFNVYPREVEDVLRTVPGVADVAVVGLPSPEWGETVTAFVVADGRFDRMHAEAVASRELARFKQPRDYRVVDELPRNAMGKVLRHVLVAGAS